MLHEGEVCLMTSPGVYCYEWYYRTNDSVEEVVDYYENLAWRFHKPVKFEWRRGRRFASLNWVAEDNVRIFSNICGYQIIVHPSSDGDTEVYILERGARSAALWGTIERAKSERQVLLHRVASAWRSCSSSPG